MHLLQKNEISLSNGRSVLSLGTAPLCYLANSYLQQALPCWSLPSVGKGQVVLALKSDL